MRFDNPEVDRLLQQAHTQHDPLTRRQTFCQIERILADERPMLYLVYFSVAHAISSELQGIVVKSGKYKDQTLTQEGMVFGTPRYMSPEQENLHHLVRGDAAGHLALGVSDLHTVRALEHGKFHPAWPFVLSLSHREGAVIIRGSPAYL